MPTTGTAALTTVAAQDAPLGVQLWPTVTDGYAQNFTLDSVDVIRDCNGTWVRWNYQNGKARTFAYGENVLVSL